MLPWKEIKTVFLDMDGTLLDLSFDNYFWQDYIPKQYAQSNHLTLHQATTKLSQHSQRVTGSLAWYCLEAWSAQLGMDIAAHKKRVSHRVSLRPQVLEFLQFCRSQNQQICLLTNAHPKTLRIKLQKIPIEQYFDHIVSAHELGYAKEQTEFWPALQRHYPFDANTTLFIDDSHCVLDAAKAYGISRLYSIAQPDSKIEPRQQAPYPLIRNFTELYT